MKKVLLISIIILTLFTKLFSQEDKNIEVDISFTKSCCQELKFIDIDSAMKVIIRDTTSVYYNDSYIQGFIKLEPSIKDTILNIKPDFLKTFILHDTLPIDISIDDSWNYKIKEGDCSLRSLLKRKKILSIVLHLVENQKYDVNEEVFISKDEKIYFIIRFRPTSQGYRITKQDSVLFVEKLWEERD